MDLAQRDEDPFQCVGGCVSKSKQVDIFRRPDRLAVRRQHLLLFRLAQPAALSLLALVQPRLLMLRQLLQDIGTGGATGQVDANRLAGSDRAASSHASQ